MVNKAIILGRLGNDPELRNSATGKTIVNFSVATSDRKKVGEKYEDQTEWHKIVTFGKTAENCAKYLKKGSQVYVEGKISTSKWETTSGETRYTTQVVANSVQFLSSKNETAENASRPQVAHREVFTKEKAQEAVAELDFDDDDIPF